MKPTIRGHSFDLLFPVPKQPKFVRTYGQLAEACVFSSFSGWE